MVCASHRNGQIRFPSIQRPTVGSAPNFWQERLHWVRSKVILFKGEICNFCTLSPSPEVRGNWNYSGTTGKKGFVEAFSLFKICKVCQRAKCHTGLVLLILMWENKKTSSVLYVHCWHCVKDRCDTTNRLPFSRLWACVCKPVFYRVCLHTTN